MNTEIILLQRDLLLEQLMEVENQLIKEGVKKDKQGFTLFRRNGVFYVRYTDLQTGKQIPTNRTLKTTDRSEAETKARLYRDSTLKSYYDKKNMIKDLAKFFGEYYKQDTPTFVEYLGQQLKKGERKISNRVIKHYEGFINNYFLDFLKKNDIKRINQITLNKLKDFQTFLVENEKGLNPKTINSNINGAIKPIFTNLLLKGVIKETPFTKNLDYRFNLPESGKRNRPHTLPIYETLMVLLDKEMWKLYKTESDMKQGIIANTNHYKKYRLICLLMATCGLRNAEIFMLRKENIIKIRRTHFIDVVNSHTKQEKEGLKTENAKRKVPIPSITLQALNEYISENNITDYLFYSGSKTIHYNMFGFASNQFGAHCGYSEKELKEKVFRFYSLRHFYKTLLARSDIKEDIVEYFSGRSVNVRNMSENYNNIEDLDDSFFEDNGLKVIDYIDNQFNTAMKKYDLFVVHTHIEQIQLTDNKGKIHSFFADVLNKIDFENEIHLLINDLQEKEILPYTEKKNELLTALKEQLDNGYMEKQQYLDCVDYVKNNAKPLDIKL